MRHPPAVPARVVRGLLRVDFGRGLDIQDFQIFVVWDEVPVPRRVLNLPGGPLHRLHRLGRARVDLHGFWLLFGFLARANTLLAHGFLLRLWRVRLARLHRGRVRGRLRLRTVRQFILRVFGRNRGLLLTYSLRAAVHRGLLHNFGLGRGLFGRLNLLFALGLIGLCHKIK